MTIDFQTITKTILGPSQPPVITRFFKQQKKKHPQLQMFLFSKWTSLGLNQGPPDYELFSLLFHRI